MTYLITALAEGDIETIIGYIAQDSKKAAQKLLQQFHQYFDLLVENPKIGYKLEQLIDLPYRIFPVRKNYLVVYAIEDSGIVILRVFNRYQNILALL